MSSSTKKVVNRKKKDVAKSAYGLHISRTIRQEWTTTGYENIVRSILGKTYSLSLVLIGDTRARALSTTYRNKSTNSNVLTFPITTTDGEVFLNIPRIQREAHIFGLTPMGHAKFLLIHACLHLKGHAHGSTMEGAENRLVRKFKLR